ncbi:MAG: low molecular weight protein-tyrosine-phosphatase [Planctomycetota bacterium]
MTESNPREPLGVLFVCLGNICRSPLAEAIFAHRTDELGLTPQLHIDSAGTGGWHVGKPADSRSIAVGRRHGIDVPSVAREVDPDEDFHRFHLIVPMDESNQTTLLEWGAQRERVRLMRSFDPALAGRPDREIEVPDPYYGDGDGFERVYQMLDAATSRLIEHVQDRLA